jgi:hypothetical protein
MSSTTSRAACFKKGPRMEVGKASRLHGDAAGINGFRLASDAAGAVLWARSVSAVLNTAQGYSSQWQ